ncbi:MAG: flagellar basal body L-ring protein FlgH [Planctomycetes bacterium]|jgi:flagellar L-ring protein precursor FlgH|nr:flagellar basal body L-ring protein FlgH [Planctomycetota bacterium]MCC7396805.1 flagellar basal body L-ring protein FlgH [Planctomycetota bacterium]
MRMLPWFTVALLGVTAAAQNPYTRPGASIAAIADRRARNVGDILTITVQEQLSIKNEDKVERKNSTSLAARLESFSLSESAFDQNALPRIDVSKDTSFNGEAKQNSGSDVRASIAVIVIDVLPNGNLVVAGTRAVTVNDETRTLRISGIVRPLDITPGNTIGSAQVADARIAITGEGGNSRQVTRGPLGQLFDVLVWAAWPF